MNKSLFRASFTGICVTLFSGCMSTGPVPMGQNVYTMSKTSVACGFRSAGGVRADLSKEMTEFCTAKQLVPELISIEALDGVIGQRCASATLEFRCVLPSVADLHTPSGQRPDRDMNRTPRTPADRGQFGRQPDDPLRVKQDITLAQQADVYSELKKLKELLDAGIITQAEFDAQKAKILAR